MQWSQICIKKSKNDELHLLGCSTSLQVEVNIAILTGHLDAVGGTTVASWLLQIVDAID